MTAGEIIEILSRVPADTYVAAESSGGEFVRVVGVETYHYHAIDGSHNVTIELD